MNRYDFLREEWKYHYAEVWKNIDLMREINDSVWKIFLWPRTFNKANRRAEFHNEQCRRLTDLMSKEP
jgi:hypothetical protein